MGAGIEGAVRVRWFITCVLVAILAVILIEVPVSTRVTKVDAHTGSRSGHTRTWFGTFGRWQEITAFDRRLGRLLPGGVEHRWVFISGDEYNVYGGTVAFTCGSNPAFELHGVWIDRWVEQASDADIVGLYELLRSRDRAKITPAVRAIADRGLELLRNQP